MLMNEKQFYTSPEVDVLVVRFEECILSTGEKYKEQSMSGSWELD
jgi:hypothetical protein